MIGEWCATEVAAETVLLSRAAAGTGRRGRRQARRVSVRQAKLRARAVAQRLDPTPPLASTPPRQAVRHHPAGRQRHDLADRDTSDAAGVAAYGALHHAAAAAKAAGDPRGRGQLMADLLTATGGPFRTADEMDTAVDCPLVRMSRSSW